MKKVLAITLVLLLALIVVLPLARPTARMASSTPDRGPSIVRMEPDTLAALRAQGKQVKYPFPTIKSNGNKFAPDGSITPAVDASGSQNVLVLFANFTTPPPGATDQRLDMQYFDDMLFGTVYDPAEYAAYPDHPTDRTLVNYYKEASYGTVDIVTLNLPSEMGWLQVGKPYEFYSQGDGIHDNGFGMYPNNVQGLVIDTVLAADAAGVDFSQYAVNGVIPNLFVVYAGTGAEWSGATDIIWSHSWDISWETPYPNGMTVDGVVINNYAMMPEVGGDLTGVTGVVTGPYPPTVGVFAHEYGHVLGLPDQYDYGYESDGTDVVSLMAGGSWNRYPNKPIFSGNSPAQMDAWSKYFLGFVQPIEVTGSMPVTIQNAVENKDIYKMVVPNSGGLEYFLLENRQQIGFDQGLARFGVHGLAIYHVDETVFWRTFWRPNEAENWKEFRSEGWRKADNGESHYAISLIQADDLWQLEKAIYIPYNPATGAGSLAGDLFPGSMGKTSFGNRTLPNSSSYYFWGGSAPKFGYSGVTVENIVESDGVITADLSYNPFK